MRTEQIRSFPLPKVSVLNTSPPPIVPWVNYVNHHTSPPRIHPWSKSLQREGATTRPRHVRMTGVEAEEAAGPSVPSTNLEVSGVNEVEGISTVSGGCAPRADRGTCGKRGALLRRGNGRENLGSLEEGGTLSGRRPGNRGVRNKVPRHS